MNFKNKLGILLFGIGSWECLCLYVAMKLLGPTYSEAELICFYLLVVIATVFTMRIFKVAEDAVKGDEISCRKKLSTKVDAILPRNSCGWPRF